MFRRPLLHLSLCCAAVAVCASAPAFANAAREFSPESPANQLVKEVDIVENLNNQVPLDASFTNADGEKVALKDLLRGDKPVVLTLVYYKCPMLCPLVLGGLSKAARQSGMGLGEDYRAVTISIDPRETPEDAKERQRGHLQSLGAPGQEKDWQFLVGDEANIKKVAEAVGFRYRFDQASQQYAHAAAITVLTPEGKVSRYLYGVEFPPRDLKLALLEAAGGRVGTSFDRVLIQCFKYDPNTRRYEVFIFGFIKGGALLVFGALAAALAVYWRREYKRGSIS